MFLHDFLYLNHYLLVGHGTSIFLAGRELVDYAGKGKDIAMKTSWVLPTLLIIYFLKVLEHSVTFDIRKPSINFNEDAFFILIATYLYKPQENQCCYM